MKFCVFSSDPLFKYHAKGEIKPRYWNPEGIFDEVLVFTFCDEDIAPDKVQALVGGARLEVVPLGPPSILGLKRQYELARRKMADFGPDLVRVHNPWHAGLIGVTAANSLGIPCILSLHTHYGARRRWEKKPLLYLLKVVERRVIPRADVVLCVTHYLTDYARSMGAAAVEVIYNRVYTEQFAAPLRRDGAEPVILSVGRLDPPKDQECLIRALPGLGARLELVGDGVNRPRLERLAQELGVSDRVVFHGAVPHAKIQQYYARADLFAMATHYEGFCIPVLEAMAAGLPVVVCKTPPLPEIVGDTGCTVDHEPAAFSQQLAALIGDGARRRCLGQAAFERARQLDGHLMERREAELYQGLIGSDLDAARELQQL